MKNNLRKTTKKGLAVVSAIVGLSVFFAACSSSDEKSVAGGVSEDAGFVADVAGVAQKGPFVKGSAVTVRGVDCKTLEFTDQIFEGTIKSDKGDFALDSIVLDSSCAVIEVTGKYLNEVTGKKTKEEVTLRTLTDLKDRESVNVNLLTSLAYERVMHLVKEKNKTLAKAKTQAESEVLAAFDIDGEFDEFENLNIFESGDGNAALLAVSVMMQGDADAAALAKRIDKFDDSFAESGKWNDSETKKAIAEWVAEAAASGELETIRKNIEDMGYAGEIPAFEKYVPTEEPADSTEESSSSAVEESSSSDVVEGETKQSSSSDKQDARDSVVTSSSSEVDADTISSSSSVLDSLVSSASVQDSLLQDSLRSSSSIAPKDSLDSLSSSSSVVDTSASVSRLDWSIPKSAYFNANIKYDTMEDRRDGRVYKTVSIGSQVWMAENLNYETDGSWCYGNDSANCEVAGRLYNWAAAVDSVNLTEKTSDCLYGRDCSLDTIHVRGVCPINWRLPDSTDWNILVNEVRKNEAGAILKSQTGWYMDGNGVDSVGFSAIPAGTWMYNTAEFEYAGEADYFWTSTGYMGTHAIYRSFSYDFDWAKVAYSDVRNGLSVRCIKN